LIEGLIDRRRWRQQLFLNTGRVRGDTRKERMIRANPFFAASPESILRMSRSGAAVYYAPENHWCQLSFPFSSQAASALNRSIKISKKLTRGIGSDRSVVQQRSQSSNKSEKSIWLNFYFYFIVILLFFLPFNRASLDTIFYNDLIPAAAPRSYNNFAKL